MDKRKKEEIVAWATASNWLLFAEGKTPDGYPQESYITPAGNVLFLSYDNEGYFRNVAVPMPSMPVLMPRPQGLPGIDLLGGQQLRPT